MEHKRRAELIKELAAERCRDEPIEAVEGEDALATAKRVNVKYMNILWFRGLPYYKFVAVNGQKGYAYDLEKGMYATRTEMWAAFEADRELQRELRAIDEAHEDHDA